MRSSTPILALLPLLSMLLSGAALASDPPPAPARAEVLRQAEDLLTQSKFAEAEAAFQQASALEGGLCGECMLGVATVRASQGAWDVTADMTQRALPLLTDPALLARAYNQLGMAFVKRQSDPERLVKAEDALRNAIDYGTTWGEVARLNLAQVLFLQGRWADASQTAREVLGKPQAAGQDLSRSARIVLCQARSHLPDELPEEAPPRAVEAGIVPPKKIAGPNPQYTDAARAAKTAGLVIVGSTVDREGCLRAAKVLQGLPNGLSEAVLEAVRFWVYSPATLNGKPVGIKYNLSVTFRP